MALLPDQTTYQWNYYYVLVVTNLALVWHTAYVAGEMDWIATSLYSLYQIGTVTIAFMIKPVQIKNEE